MLRDRWTYNRGMPDRSGVQVYTHLIMSPDDPKETMKRGSYVDAKGVRRGHRELDGANDKLKKGGTPKYWCRCITKLLGDGEPRTFNRICIELIGVHASVVLHCPIDQGLWLAVETRRIAWTTGVPVHFTVMEAVEWPETDRTWLPRRRLGIVAR